MTAILDSNQCCRFCGPTPKPLGQWQLYIHFAEAVGFEPTEPFGSLVFKTSAIDQLCQTSNHIFIYSCGSRRIRTFGTFRFGTLAVCWFKPLTHTSIQGIWYFNCCSLLQSISYFNDMIQQ